MAGAASEAGTCSERDAADGVAGCVKGRSRCGAALALVPPLCATARPLCAARPDRAASAVRWFTLAAEQGNEYARYFLDHMDDSPSLFTSATRLLHHMGRIFQEQAPPPSGGISFVDSKLRGKIREKKIAMGHKPDDHEEPVQQLR